MSAEKCIVIGVTGHRPQKLGGHGPGARALRIEVAKVNLAALRSESEKPVRVLAGMALGWDQACAQAAIELDIPFVAAVPCHRYEVKWPPHAQEQYRALLAAAAETVYVSREYSPTVFTDRNKWIVDRSDLVLACWGGGVMGGTTQCVNYAARKNVHVKNVFNEFARAYEIVNGRKLTG